MYEMRSITTLRTYMTFYARNKISKSSLCNIIESNICALVFFNLLNPLRESGKMLDKPRILSLFSNPFNKVINTPALM